MGNRQHRPIRRPDGTEPRGPALPKGGLYGLKARARDYLRLVLGTVPYQFLLSFAAVRAVVRELRGDGSWEKTSHANTHRTKTLDLRDEIDLRDEPLVRTR